MNLPLLPQDKANHVVYGAVIALIATYLATFFHLPAPGLIGLVAAAVFAIGKEVYDRVSGKGTPDPHDADATYFGGALVALAAVVGQV